MSIHKKCFQGGIRKTIHLFVLRFYGPVNPMGHVERGQFT